MNQRQHMFNSIILMLAFFIIRPTYFFFAIPLGVMIPDMDIHLQRAGIGRHRKTLHNIWVPLLLLFVGYWAGVEEFGLFLGIGVVAHLIADMLSRTKTYPLYPLDFSVSGVVSFTKPARAKNSVQEFKNEVQSAKATLAYVMLNVCEVLLLFISMPYIKILLNFFLGLA